MGKMRRSFCRHCEFAFSGSIEQHLMLSVPGRLLREQFEEFLYSYREDLE